LNSLQSIVERHQPTFAVDASFLTFGAKKHRDWCGIEETIYSNF